MSRSSAHRAQLGVTLIEVLIALLVGIIALLALYGLVDTSNKLTKQQTEVADVQQSARIGIYQLSRIIRQSRLGGLYLASAVLPIANNVAGGTFYTDSKDNSKHYVRKGTDVIAVRGILLGDRYAFMPGDISCAGPCNTTTALTIIIRSTTVRGYVNFPSAGSPSLSSKARPFYFVVEDEANQSVTAGGSTYVVPNYLVGRVNATGNWFTLDTTTNPANPTFTFTMNPQDTGAQKFNATSSLAPAINRPVRGGAVDEVRFFVDEGASDATGSTADTHPTLAQATLDPSTGNYDIQTLIEEVEDFQIAYGVDGVNGSAHDGGVSPTAIDTTGVNKDEWVGNVATEVENTLTISASDPKHVDAFVDTTVASGSLGASALHSIWISLVVKSADPDLVYDGPGARGIQILDSAAVSFSAATGRPYRRRPLSLAVALRNYSS